MAPIPRPSVEKDNKIVIDLRAALKEKSKMMAESRAKKNLDSQVINQQLKEEISPLVNEINMVKRNLLKASDRVLAEPICVKERKPFQILHEEILNAKQRKLDQRKNGFERGWQLEEIIDARLYEGKQQFLIKWKQSEKTEYIDAIFMKDNYPQAVIAFYQASIVWSR